MGGMEASLMLVALEIINHLFLTIKLIRFLGCSKPQEMIS